MLISFFFKPVTQAPVSAPSPAACPGNTQCKVKVSQVCYELEKLSIVSSSVSLSLVRSQFDLAVLRVGGSYRRHLFPLEKKCMTLWDQAVKIPPNHS